MSNIHICFSTKPNCWNLEARCYGTCYGCHCCAKDKLTRYKARIAYLDAMLKEEYEFDMWDDTTEGRKLQEKNIKKDIRWFKRLKRYYVKKLAELPEPPKEVSE